MSNIGGGPSSGPVTVNDTVPAGLTPTAAAGAGWVCNIAGQAVSCTRADALNAGASYPAITLTVNVAPAAPPSLTNTAQVSGGGEINTANNTASDITTIGPGADLTITKSHTGNFTQGQTGATYTVTVTNAGVGSTSGSVTVTDNVPIGLVPTSAAGAGWTCNIAAQAVICNRSDPLAPGQSYPAITLAVSVQPDAPASVTNTAVVSAGGDVNSSNNSASDPTTIIAVADLTLAKTHTGSFLQGQVGATYTLTVSNIGGGPSSGPVTVNDTLPVGLTPTAAAGAGWVCNIAAQVGELHARRRAQCRSQLSGHHPHGERGAGGPAIVDQHRAVAGGGEINTANNTASDITTIGARARPDHHQEPRGQLHAGTDRRNLHHHCGQHGGCGDNRLCHGHRHRAEWPERDKPEWSGLELYGGDDDVHAQRRAERGSQLSADYDYGGHRTECSSIGDQHARRLPGAAMSIRATTRPAIPR